MVTIADIEAAKKRIGGYIFETPVIRLNGLDEILGCEVYAKPECMQKTQSFKIRGALNKMLSLSKEQLANGVVTSSSGNHGKGIAYAAKLLGVKACIVLPDTAPAIKVEGIKALGAEVVQCDITERMNVANALKAEKGYLYIHPFDDPDIIAGQGTCGYEIVRQLADVDTIVVPIGGGGLISGTAIAAKALKPTIKIVGVEPAVVSRYAKSLAAGAPVSLPSAMSIADALLSTAPGVHNYPLVQQYVDTVVSTSDEYIVQGAKTLLLWGKIIAELSSAIGIGAILQGSLQVSPEDKVCFLLSGGNIELSTIGNL